jgi:hypothetical protein
MPVSPTQIGKIGGIFAPIFPPNPLRRNRSHRFGLEMRRARLGLRQRLWIINAFLWC